MNRFILIPFLLFWPITPCYASEATVISKDSPAPYTGLLLTPGKAEEVRKGLMERDDLRLLVDSLKRSAVIHTELETSLIKQRQDLITENVDKYRTNDMQKIFWFVLGAAVTTLSVYAVSKASK